MSSLSSLDDELTNDAIEELVKEGGYVILSTTDLGHRFRGERPCHILKLEAPEIEQDFETIRHSRNWEHTQRLRIIMDCSPESMTRYVPDQNFENVIYKRITSEYDFGSISDWIHGQTTGKWTMKVLADKRRRPKHSFLMFSFENLEAAMFFKLFQI